MLAWFLAALCTSGALVSHIGGDDFLMGVFIVLAVVFLLAAADTTGD